MFKNILLAVECSPEAMRAAGVAIALARNYQANLIVLHVVDAKAVTQYADFSGKSKEEVAIEMEEKGWKYLYNIEEEAIGKGVKTMLHLQEGRPPEITVEFAHRLKADLLVYPRLQQAGSRGMRISKAIDQLIAHAPCPLLLV